MFLISSATDRPNLYYAGMGPHRAGRPLRPVGHPGPHPRLPPGGRRRGRRAAARPHQPAARRVARPSTGPGSGRTSTATTPPSRTTSGTGRWPSPTRSAPTAATAPTTPASGTSCARRSRPATAVAFHQDEQESVPLLDPGEDRTGLRRLEVGDWSGADLLGPHRSGRRRSPASPRGARALPTSTARPDLPGGRRPLGRRRPRRRLRPPTRPATATDVRPRPRPAPPTARRAADDAPGRATRTEPTTTSPPARRRPLGTVDHEKPARESTTDRRSRRPTADDASSVQPTLGSPHQPSGHRRHRSTLARRVAARYRLRHEQPGDGIGRSGAPDGSARHHRARDRRPRRHDATWRPRRRARRPPDPPRRDPSAASSRAVPRGPEGRSKGRGRPRLSADLNQSGPNCPLCPVLCGSSHSPCRPHGAESATVGETTQANRRPPSARPVQPGRPMQPSLRFLVRRVARSRRAPGAR